MSLKAIDFAKPAPRSARLGLPLLVAGSLAFSGAVICHQRFVSERSEEVQRQAEALHVSRLNQPIAENPLSNEKNFWRATRERGRPWMQALRAVEAATASPVYLLSMSINAGSGAVRLEGEAPSFEHALAYVQILPDGMGISSASLLTHEQINEPITGRSKVLFAVSAQWAQP